jgi:excinuclease ABC subunit B
LNSFKLYSKWQPRGDQPKAIEDLVAGFSQGKREQTLLGVTGSGKTFVMAHVMQTLNMPTLVMAPNKTLAAQLYSEFKSFFPENAVEYFVSYYDFYQPEAYVPQRDMYIEKDASINEQIDRLRLAATSSLMSRRDVVIVASVSCIYSLGDPEDYQAMELPLAVNQTCVRDDVIHRLVAMQYTRNDFDISRGNFRVRGDVLEIWPGYAENKLRVELFGDVVERLSWCHPLTNETLQQVPSLVLYPSKHYVMPQEKVKKALAAIEDELGERLAYFNKEGKLLEATRLRERTLYDLEMLHEVGFCSGIENYSRHFSQRKPGERPYCLLDYFPKPYLTIVDESHISLPQIKGMYVGDRARKETLVAYGFRLPSALDNRPNRLEEWQAITDHVMYVSATPGPYELKRTNGEVVEQVVRPTGLLDPLIEVHPTSDQIPHLTALIKERTAAHQRVLVTTLTKRLSEDLCQFLHEEKIEVAYLHCDIDAFERVRILQDLRKGKYDALVGINLLREGLDLPEVSLVAILDADRQGFLRSETSLIQIMGRAARHVEAKVILYADNITAAMQNAMRETTRRRQIQLAYNQTHGITPQSVHKEILQSIDYVLNEPDPNNPTLATLAETAPAYLVDEKIAQLKAEMAAASQKLEFERAAALRDQIFALEGKESPEREQIPKGRKRARNKRR